MKDKKLVIYSSVMTGVAIVLLMLALVIGVIGGKTGAKNKDLETKLTAATAANGTLNEQLTQLKEQVGTLEAENESMENEITENDYTSGTLEEQMEELSAQLSQLNQASAESAQVLISFTDTDRQQLAAAGFESLAPVAEAIKAHKEVIPFEATLGGSFFISEVKLLSSTLAYAICEDGHVQGRLLLAYTAGEGKVSEVKVLYSKED